MRNQPVAIRLRLRVGTPTCMRTSNMAATLGLLLKRPMALGMKVRRRRLLARTLGHRKEYSTEGSMRGDDLTWTCDAREWFAGQDDTRTLPYGQGLLVCGIPS